VRAGLSTPGPGPGFSPRPHPPTRSSSLHRRPAQAGRQAGGDFPRPRPRPRPAHTPRGYRPTAGPSQRTINDQRSTAFDHRPLFERRGQWNSSSLQAPACADAFRPQAGRQGNPDRAFLGLLRPLLYHDPTMPKKPAPETDTPTGGRFLKGRICDIIPGDRFGVCKEPVPCQAVLPFSPAF